MIYHLPFDWDWVRVVTVYSIIIFAISTPIIFRLLKLLNLPRVTRLATWSRWVLVLPMAFLFAYISETIPRILFAIIEIAINHQLTFRPGVDCLIWQAYSPIFFVTGGMKIAPSHRFGVFIMLAGMKISVSIMNIYNVISFTSGGGGWDRLDPILDSPLWWNVSVYVLSVVILISYGSYLGSRSINRQIAAQSS
jgi:hypothetical protein